MVSKNIRGGVQFVQAAGYTHVEYSSRVDPAFVVYTAGRWLQSCVAQLILSVP